MLSLHETNEKLATILIARLNAMIEADPAIGPALWLLVGHRVELPDRALLDHPTIQVAERSPGTVDSPIEVGFLGMLNGIVGAIPYGKHEKWGYIAAVVEEDRSVSAFRLTTAGHG